MPEMSLQTSLSSKVNHKPIFQKQNANAVA